MTDDKLRNTLVGFGAVGLLFGAAEGFMIRAAAATIAPAALIGALIGIGFVFLAWRPRPQDQGPPAPEPVKHPNYMLIWGVLFVLTIVEVVVALQAFSKVGIIVTLLVLAIWKALLVALYYMHLKYEPRRLWLVVASPLPLAAILLTAVLSEGW